MSEDITHAFALVVVVGTHTSILAVLHGGDVCGDSGIGANAIAIHHLDQICFR